MTIKKIMALIALCALTAAGCADKSKKRDLDLGMTLVNRTVDYLLKGKEKMASYSYIRTISKFRDMGDFCNMARTAIIIVTLDPEGSLPLIEDARAFAALGNCAEETNIIMFLSKNEYDGNKLPNPYKALAAFEKTGKINVLTSLAASRNISDRNRSMLLRTAAYAIAEENPSKAYKLAEEASVIDSEYAWTLNLVKNEEIKLKAAEALGKPADTIRQRIRILEQSLDEKY
ncbi:MAG: hypothetical protein K2N67_03710 [Mucispirillum sp.]|nr:hypothetical protein [Mucispirillum sp.]